MPLVIPNNHAQVVLNFAHPSTPREMSVTFGVGYEPDPFDPEKIVNRVAGCFTDSTLQARMDASVTLTTIGVTCGQVGDDPVIFEKAFNLQGGTAFETPPLNTALLVKKNSALGGRANRGRFYWPGLLAETDVNEVGIIGGAQVIAIQADFDAFYDALDAIPDGDEEQLVMVILHDSTSPATTPTIVSSLTVDGTAATQRRRMRG